jgi:hypothetical protein
MLYLSLVLKTTQHWYIPDLQTNYKTGITSGPYQAGVASGHTGLVGSLLPLLIPGAGLYASLYTRPTLAGTIFIQSLHPWEILHCMAVNQIWLATKSCMGLFLRSGRPFCCQWAQISFPPSVWGGSLAKKLFGWGVKSQDTQRGKGSTCRKGRQDQLWHSNMQIFWTILAVQISFLVEWFKSL